MSPTPTPTPVATSSVGTLPAPSDSAPSGTLYRVGLKSDVLDLAFGPPGQRWIVVSAGRAETLRGTLHLRPEGRAAGRYQVQVGAFSQEELARKSAQALSARFETTGSVAFSADRGVYRVLLGSFPDRAAAENFAARVRESGQEAFVVEGGTAPVAGVPLVSVSGEDGSVRHMASPVDIYPSEAGSRLLFDNRPYRGSLRLLANPRGSLNAVNRVDLEEYLYGVVPSEMGPKRYDELEALKAQAIAARTYALAHRGQFESEGYDLCATPKCQVYSGVSLEDPLSNAAVDATRGLVLAYEGRLANALFVSTCGGATENVENVFGEPALAYLVSVDCGELETTKIPGAALDRSGAGRERSGLQWRGHIVQRHARRTRAPRAAQLELVQRWAGVDLRGSPPSVLTPAAVYPSLLAAFDLEPAKALHLLPRDERYYSESPSASGRLAGAAQEAYDFLIRLRFGAGEEIPAPDHTLTEEEYAGLLFSVALRLSGVTEGSGRFTRREGSNLWVKTGEGRVGLPVDPELPLGRRVGNRYLASASLTLRPGDRLRWWKAGSQLLALWVEMEAVGPAFERESAWTEWIRRVSGKELARRMAGRIVGSEVREIAVTKRSTSGRATEIHVKTDAAEAAFQRFELRQALELPEMLFAVERVSGPQGEVEFVFVGRGWGHGVGLCQNGAYGMALAGTSAEAILRHYYRSVEIVTASSLAPAVPGSSP